VTALQSPDVVIPPLPPMPPTPVVPQIRIGPAGRVTIDGSPSEAYQAAYNRRESLKETRNNIQEQRDEISGQLQDPMVNGANRQGLESRIQQLDARILQLDQQIAQADVEVAAAAGIPGARPPEPISIRDNGPPPEVFLIPIAVIVFVLGPLSIAAAIRMLRRGKAAVAATPSWLQDRLGRIEQSVDAMALEVERISEGQRFLTKLFADGGARAVGQGAAQPVEVGARERVAERSAE
jgi:hypothetical protein